MFKQYFDFMESADIYPIISLLVFFLFFIGIAVYLIFINKNYIEKMESLPLDESENEFNNLELNNHNE